MVSISVIALDQYFCRRQIGRMGLIALGLVIILYDLDILICISLYFYARPHVTIGYGSLPSAPVSPWQLLYYSYSTDADTVKDTG